jgi:hypothetical protein
MTRLAIVLVVVVGWVVTGWLYVGHVRDTAFSAGYEQATNEVKAVALAAQSSHEAAHRTQIETVKEAQDAREKKLVAVQADAGRMRVELGGLRDEIARARGRDVPAPSADATPCNCTAERELQRILGEELERISEAGIGLAQQCDGHAADSLMFQRAWPD